MSANEEIPFDSVQDMLQLLPLLQNGTSEIFIGVGVQPFRASVQT
jgi:hypothetical protein